LIKNFFYFFSAVIFFNFRSLKPWIRIGIQPKMLDPDPDEMNADPQPWLKEQRRGKRRTQLQMRRTMMMLRMMGKAMEVRVVRRMRGRRR
jgi:hypothetical protein